MDFFEMPIFPENNSFDSFLVCTKNLEPANSDKSELSKKNEDLIQFKHSNSLLSINQAKEVLYIKCIKQKRKNDKFFLDNRIEKIYQNFLCYINIDLNELWCNKKIIVYNIIKDINKKKNVNRNINDEEILTHMNTKDSLSLLSPKKQNCALNFSYSKKNYCKYFPKETDMRNKPGQKPSSFPIETFLGSNESHNKIGNKEFIDIKGNTFCSENDSYKVVNSKQHELLNHFLQKNCKISSISFRYRHKNSTFIYYK